MTVRKNAEVHVTSTIDGSKRVKMKQRGERRPAQTVNNRQIHPDIYDAALKAADGDARRLDWNDTKVVDGIIVEIRVLNKPKR